MRRRRYESVFVPAHDSLWQRFLRWLFPPRRERVYREPTRPMPQFWNQTPTQVWHYRRRANDATMLLRRYLEDKPVSRRSCVQAGFTQARWQKARLMLIAAKVLDRDGNLLYTPKDSERRLEAYLQRMERKVNAESRFIAP
jgi:hypothetical protein